MKDQILPCPFCGGPASIEEFSSAAAGDAVVFSVGCDSYSEEHCQGYQSLTMFSTRGEAIKAWNRRAPEQSRQVNTVTDKAANGERIDHYVGSWRCGECQTLVADDTRHACKQSQQANRDIPKHDHTHSLYVHCLACRTFGINLPTRFIDASPCGNCGSMETVKYYPSCCILADREVAQHVNAASAVDADGGRRSSEAAQSSPKPVGSGTPATHTQQSVQATSQDTNMVVSRDGESLVKETAETFNKENLSKGSEPVCTHWQSYSTVDGKLWCCSCHKEQPKQSKPESAE